MKSLHLLRVYGVAAVVALSLVSMSDAQSQDLLGRVRACPAGALRVKAGDRPNAVLSRAGVGGKVCFDSGTYRLESALEPLARQTLIFLKGAALNGSRIVRRWTREDTYWVSTGHTQDFPSSVTGLPDAIMCESGPAPCIYEDVYMDGRPLMHVTDLGSLRPGRVFFDEVADKIYIATNPSGHEIEATVVDRGITSGASDVTIRGATIEKFAYNGIGTAGNRWTIEDSNIHYVHLTGIAISGSGHQIRDNRIHHNGIVGMTGLDLANVTISDNELDHNNYLNAGPRAFGHHEGAVKIMRSHDVVFRGNWSHHNDGDGLWFDTDNYDIIIENNLLEANTRNGLHYEASFDAVVRHNKIRRNGKDRGAQGSGIYNSTSKNVEYYGNTIANNAIRTILIGWHDRGVSSEFGERQSANLYFHDNVIVFANNEESWVGVYTGEDSRVYTSNNRFEANTYIAHADGRWWQWETRLTWSEWRAKGFDTSGTFRVRD